MKDGGHAPLEGLRGKEEEAGEKGRQREHALQIHPRPASPIRYVF